MKLNFFSHLKKKQIVEKKNRRFNNINKKSYIFYYDENESK